MTTQTDDKGWSPYLAGALVGILAILSVLATHYLLDKAQFLGTSTTFVRAAGLLESSVASEHVAANAYFTLEKVKVDWQFMLVCGIFFGALISARLDNSFRLEAVPPLWAERFGSSITTRAIGAFLGGIIAMIGVRLANGCPSGNGLSGMMQLSVSGFVAVAMFFLGGLIVATLVYRRNGS